MEGTKADLQPDFLLDADEPVSSMEPLLLNSECDSRSELNDLCLELAKRSSGLRNSIPEGMVPELAKLVRSMNCYYSNLIEGHDTHPIEIERALAGDYSADREKRNLQLEAAAHICVQEWIDNGGIRNRILSTASFLEIHKRFCDKLPEELLWVEGEQKKVKVIPGEFRRDAVKVGKHIPVSPGAIPRFAQRFEEAYEHLGKLDRILSIPAAHHRFLWIHPFLDGNGRVARLLSYAQLLEALDTGGIWSVARGLARKVEAYKTHLMDCDAQRKGDYDGRGNLSQAALIQFTRFFLEVCLDQVSFMESLIQPEKLRFRILQWANEESQAGHVHANAGRVLEGILYRGELPRAEVPDLLGVGERQARRVVSNLIEIGVITSNSDRAPLQLCFPAVLAHRWMPGLFPQAR